MPFVKTNGVRIAYQRSGHGEPVLLIMGSGAAGHVWTMYQTPALNEAGYETITFDNRGTGTSDSPPGRYSLTDLVTDTIGLIEALGLGPCHVVGTSMGAAIAQEIALTHPELVRSAVFLATRARADVMRHALADSDRILRESGVTIPPRYNAVRKALEMLSPTTLNDDTEITPWLDIIELAGGGDHTTDGQSYVTLTDDRRDALRAIPVPCRVIAYADDVICPPHLGAEVAEAIPDCDLVVLPHCGHLGNLERPPAVNDAITTFLARHRSNATP